jgi:hypothetical protein
MVTVWSVCLTWSRTDRVYSMKFNRSKAREGEERVVSIVVVRELPFIYSVVVVKRRKR